MIIPGILSQGTGFTVDGNIGPGVAAFLPEAPSSEVPQASPAPSPELVLGCCSFEVSQATEAVYLPSFEILLRQVYFAPPGFEELLIPQTGDSVSSVLRTFEEVSDLETGSPVLSILTALDLQTKSEPGVKLITIGTAIDLSGVRGSLFLPGSPGYVAGFAPPAVELVGVEVGYPPQPLPVGFIGTARDIYRVELASPQVGTTKPAKEIDYFAAIEKQINSAKNALFVSRIELVSRPLIGVAGFNDLIYLESGLEVSSTGSAEGRITIEATTLYNNERILQASISQIQESPERELQQLPRAYELLLSSYAAESAITKP